ncbi:MAG: hypothetical protein AUK07_00610 [Parcubacteria group bacterium CG2_30_36_21]|nr:MAG: hypothetical protein AUK07_00610 [Parcubacteria group bacterium CG2_30_36_21]
MRSILRENNNFQKFSRYCEEKESIEKELNDLSISDGKKEDGKKEKLEKRLRHLKKEVSELAIILQNEIKLL